MSGTSPSNVCKRLDNLPIIFAWDATLHGLLQIVLFARMASCHSMSPTLRRLADLLPHHFDASPTIKLPHHSVTCRLSLIGPAFCQPSLDNHLCRLATALTLMLIPFWHSTLSLAKTRHSVLRPRSEASFPF